MEGKPHLLRTPDRLRAPLATVNPRTARRRRRSPAFPTGIAGLLLAVLPSGAVGCSRAPQVVIPRKADAEEQFLFALEQDKRYRTTLSKYRRPRMAWRAVSAYQKVIDKFPESDLLVDHSRLGIAMIDERMGNLNDAMDVYEHLLEKRPDDDRIQIFGLFGAGKICDLRGEHSRAKEYYGELLRRYDNEDYEKYKDTLNRAREQYGRIREE